LTPVTEPLDRRYVTLSGFLDLFPAPVTDAEAVDPQVVADAVHERLKACHPGHSLAKRLIDRNAAPNSIQLLSNNNWYIYNLLMLTQKHK